MDSKPIHLTVLLLLATNSYAALDEKEFAKCAALEGDLHRLECFDQLAKNNKLEGPQVVPTAIADKGKWYVSVKENPVDDSKTVTLILDADSGVSRSGSPISIIARCQSNSTDLYIAWDDYLGGDAYVLTRIGNNKAVTEGWRLSRDSQASFHPKPVQFLKEMFTSNKLVAQITPYNENPVTAIFDTSGLENAIKPLREICKW